MTVVRPLMSNFKMTVRGDCDISAWSPSLSVYKSSYLLIVSRVGNPTLDRGPPSPDCPQLLASKEVKQTLLSIT